ncbi:unnamed protein product [Sphagnum troendelagicum]
MLRSLYKETEISLLLQIVLMKLQSFPPPSPLDTRDETYEKRETVSSKAEIVLNDLKELNQPVEDKEETVGSGGGLTAAHQIYGKSSSTSEGTPYGCMQLIRGQWPKNR